MSHIKIGEQLPSFSLPNQAGVIVNIDDIKRERNLILYFYPKDNTLVCTKEARGFRDSYPKFEGFDCEIVGISADSTKSHHKFATDHFLPFTLLSDTNNLVRKLLGVPRDLLGLASGRYTYVVNKSGTIVKIINDHLVASKHINEALKALKNEQTTDQ